MDRINTRYIFFGRKNSILLSSRISDPVSGATLYVTIFILCIFRETFQKQPPGVRNFCYYRYMAIRASLFRLGPQRYVLGDQYVTANNHATLSVLWRFRDYLRLLMGRPLCSHINNSDVSIYMYISIHQNTISKSLYTLNTDRIEE